MIVMATTVDNMKNPPTFEIYFSSREPGTHKEKHTHQVFLELPTGQSRIHSSKMINNNTFEKKMNREDKMRRNHDFEHSNHPATKRGYE